jgi:hypothetical protein
MTERDKLRKFWSEQGQRRLATTKTPLFTRLHNNVVRNSDIRHLHNRFGWQACEGKLCAGTLYRTEAFMLLADDRRCAIKALGQTIHLEHTVPVATLAARIADFKRGTVDDTILWFLVHSVTTAVTDGQDCERQTMVQTGQSRLSHAFTTGHPDQDLPFRRYRADRHSPIWDLVTGKPVNPDRFTFADHRANITTALHWAGLTDWASLVP